MTSTNQEIKPDYSDVLFSKGSALDARNSLVLACWELGPGHPSYRPGRDNRHVCWANEFGD